MVKLDDGAGFYVDSRPAIAHFPSQVASSLQMMSSQQCKMRVFLASQATVEFAEKEEKELNTTESFEKGYHTTILKIERLTQKQIK